MKLSVLIVGCLAMINACSARETCVEALPVEEGNLAGMWESYDTPSQHVLILKKSGFFVEDTYKDSRLENHVKGTWVLMKGKIYRLNLESKDESQKGKRYNGVVKDLTCDNLQIGEGEEKIQYRRLR